MSKRRHESDQQPNTRARVDGAAAGATAGGSSSGSGCSSGRDGRAAVLAEIEREMSEQQQTLEDTLVGVFAELRAGNTDVTAALAVVRGVVHELQQFDGRLDEIESGSNKDVQAWRKKLRARSDWMHAVRAQPAQAALELLGMLHDAEQTPAGAQWCPGILAQPTPLARDLEPRWFDRFNRVFKHG